MTHPLAGCSIISSAGAPSAPAPSAPASSCPPNTPVERTGGRELDAFYAVGHLLYEQGDFARAAHVFRYVLFVDPTRADAWLALGACHECADDVDVAAAIYRCGFGVAGRDPELGLHAARAHARCDDYDDASQVLEALADLELDVEQRKRLEAVATLTKGRRS